MVDSVLSHTRRGAWIINVFKHLSLFDPMDQGLMILDDIMFAGKCGKLLIMLTADADEQLTINKVKAHARLCGILPQELAIYLETLAKSGCLGCNQSNSVCEVYARSRSRVLATTSEIFDHSPVSACEAALPDLLEFCLRRPRLESEVKQYLSQHLDEQDINLLLATIRNFEILGFLSNEQTEPLYFNEYQFGDRVIDINKALQVLPDQKREQLTILTDKVAEHPGIPPESIEIPRNITEMAIGLGLVEANLVPSRAGGSAYFLTPPRLSPPSVGSQTAHLEDDVFHHAKMLLSSLRFGELRSEQARGRIHDPSILVNALLKRGAIGPCTAIGEDYTLLEKAGVIRTVQAKHKSGDQFYMELRRIEPAQIVHGLLSTGSSGVLDARSLPPLSLPIAYSGPEISRPSAVKRLKDNDPEVFAHFMEKLRT